MKITPLEIRQKAFNKSLRGYDKDEVDAFLTSLSQEWEKMIDQQKVLTLKVSSLEREVEKMRQVENTLFKTLKTAEDTGNNVVEQANRSAELHIKETELKAEQLLAEARNEARLIIDQADHDAKHLLADMYEEAKELQQNYRSMSSHHESLVKDLKKLADDTLTQIESLSVIDKTEVLDEQVADAKALKKAADRVIAISSPPAETPTIPLESAPESDEPSSPLHKSMPDEHVQETKTLGRSKDRKQASEEVLEEPLRKTGTNQSFFDELD